jgi:hypothetical protein
VDSCYDVDEQITTVEGKAILQQSNRVLCNSVWVRLNHKMACTDANACIMWVSWKRSCLCCTKLLWLAKKVSAQN